jgi:hypothetical protein
MKTLMMEWRHFLLEASVKYSGILKITPGSKTIKQVKKLQNQIKDPNAVVLSEADIHVTAVHQNFMKPFRKELKKMKLIDAPEPVLDIDRGIQIKKDGEKKSWAIALKNQEEMREYVKNIMEMLGSQNTNPEPERVFHVSLANLTGNPHDSVR